MMGVSKDDVFIKHKGNLIWAYVRAGGKLYGQAVEMSDHSKYWTRRIIAELVYDVNRLLVCGPHKMEAVDFDPAIDGR